MNRRELIKAIGVITGYSMVGGASLLSSCNLGKGDSNNIFNTKEIITFLNEMAEVILPQSGTPGAKAVDAGTIMSTIISDCYTKDEQQVIKNGLKHLDKYCKDMTGHVFSALSSNEKLTSIKDLLKEASSFNKSKNTDTPIHYISMLKQLSIFCFFTSKKGATEVLRYLPVPGKYDGDYPYKKGDKAWAT